MKEQEPSGEMSTGALQAKSNCSVHCSVGFIVGKMDGIADGNAVG